SRTNHRSDLKNTIIPRDGVRECVTRNQGRKKRAARSPTERARRRSDEKKQVNQRHRRVIEKKHLGMALEYRRNCREGAIALTERRDLGNGKMFPRNQSKGQRRDRAQDLRDKDNVFSAESIRQMAGWQRKRNHWDGDRQANKPECSRRMGPGINLPFHRYGEHQSPGDRQQIAGCKQSVISEAERSVWIVGSGFGFDRQRNGGPLPVRGSIRTRIDGMGHGRRRRIKRASESRLSGQHSNPRRMAENAPKTSITAVLPSSDPVRNSLKGRGFFFHFRVPLPKIAPARQNGQHHRSERTAD